MSLKRVPITPTQIHLAGTALTVTAFAFSAYSIYKSWESRQSGIQTSQRELTKVTAQLSATQQERGRLANQISNLQAIVSHTDRTPRPTNINELAVKLVASTEENNLALDQFEPSVPTIVGTDRIQQIAVRSESTYTNLVQWLNLLHETMPDIHVVSVSIRTQNADESTVYSDIRLNWYIPTDQ